MILLMITVCATAAMDDCWVSRLGEFETPIACTMAKQRAEIVLGRGPDQNYRLDCEEGEEV